MLWNIRHHGRDNKKNILKKNYMFLSNTSQRMSIFSLMLLLHEKLYLIGIFVCNKAKNLNFLTTSMGFEHIPAIHLGTRF